MTQIKAMTVSLQHSGMIVDLADPRPDTLLIEDIAHNLAVESRFTGATNWEEYGYAYSVGQHSCLVSDILPQELKLCGLMHDAPEAYLRDVHTQIKKLTDGAYKRLEKIFWNALSRKYNLPMRLPHQVKDADMIALVTEGRDLCHGTWKSLEFKYEPLPDKIVVWSPIRTKEEFLKRFYSLV